MRLCIDILGVVLEYVARSDLSTFSRVTTTWHTVALRQRLLYEAKLVVRSYPDRVARPLSYIVQTTFVRMEHSLAARIVNHLSDYYSLLTLFDRHTLSTLSGILDTAQSTECKRACHILRKLHQQYCTYRCANSFLYCYQVQTCPQDL